MGPVTVRDGALTLMTDAAMRKFLTSLFGDISRVLLYVIILSLSTVSCRQSEAEPGLRTIVVDASFLGQSSEDSRSDELAQYYEEDGIKASWTADDIIDVYDAEGHVNEFRIKEIRADGSASFSGSVSAKSGSKLTVVLRNKATTAATYDASAKTLTVDLSSQDGSLEDACAHGLAYASATYTDSKSVKFIFQQKTSILKFELALPEGSTDGQLSSFILSCGSAGSKAYFNSLTIDVASGQTSFGAQGASGTDGDIVTPDTASVVPSNGVATLYLSVCPSALQNSLIECAPSGKSYLRYVWRVAGSNPLVPEEGRMYCLTRARCETVASGTIWVDDSELTVNGVKIPENRSGWPQLTSAVTNLWGNTYSCDVLQIEEKDFAGAYALEGDIRSVETVPDVKAAQEDVAGRYGINGGCKKGYWYDNSWVRPSSSSSASVSVDASYLGEESGGLSLTGLCHGLALPAEVRIDRDAREIKFCLKIEDRSYLMTEGSHEGEYLAFQTQLIDEQSGRYELGIGSCGAFEYKGTVSLESGDYYVTFAKKQTSAKYPACQVTGIMVNRYAAAGNGSTEDPWLIRSTANTYCYSNPESSGAAYIWAVQGTFTLRRATGKAPVDDITVPGYHVIN